jgi:hypothetical protein
LGPAIAATALGATAASAHATWQPDVKAALTLRGVFARLLRDLAARDVLTPL